MKKSNNPFDARSRPHLWQPPLVERSLRKQGHDELGEARCPLCNHVLLPRLGKTGPYFQCGC